MDPPPSSQISFPDTPPANPPVSSHKKGGRPPNARKGKLGKNQHTKEKDHAEGDDPSPKRSQSRDVTKGEENGHTAGNKSSNHEHKTAKSKANIGTKFTMADMKKRVSAILEFISRTQVEMAGESMSRTTEEAAGTMIRGLVDNLPMIKVNGNTGDGSKAGETGNGPPSKEFKDLSCMEMMDVLTRQLVKWQKEFT